MRHILFSVFFGLIICIFSGIVYAETITFTWYPNTESDLAGYRLRWGTTSGTYPNVVDVGNVTTGTLDFPDDGTTVYVVGTAYDTSNNESDYSTEVVYTTTDIVPPSPPTSFKIE